MQLSICRNVLICEANEMCGQGASSFCPSMKVCLVTLEFEQTFLRQHQVVAHNKPTVYDLQILKRRISTVNFETMTKTDGVTKVEIRIACPLNSDGVASAISATEKAQKKMVRKSG
jgi:hypothetical protein